MAAGPRRAIGRVRRRIIRVRRRWSRRSVAGTVAGSRPGTPWRRVRSIVLWTVPRDAVAPARRQGAVPQLHDPDNVRVRAGRSARRTYQVVADMRSVRGTAGDAQGERGM